MSCRIRNGVPAVIVLAISAMMVLVPAGVTVHASTCAGGLNPSLRLTLLVPSSNPARIAWAAIVQNSQFSCTLAVCPNGQNYYLWNSTQNDQISNLIKTTLDRNTRLGYVKQWQVLANNELPSIPIFYTKEIVAFGNQYPNAQQVFNVYHFPAWPPIEHLSASGTSSFILAETGQAPGEGIVPELSTSYYDLAVSGEIFGSLALRNDTIFKTMIPDLADGTPSAPGWTSSPDGTTWNVMPGSSWVVRRGSS